MGVSDYLARIEELTNTNLKLLKALNDSFYTDQTHLSVNMGEEGQFVVPSFVSLENKLNALQDNFENLVKSPVTSDAYFVFDGNSRAIQVRGYEQSPDPLTLREQTEFYHENNDVLKDFLTPVPFLKFDVSEIPNDVTSVITRKISAVSDVAKERLSSFLTVDDPENYKATKSVDWGDIKKVLDFLEDGTDYVLYDTVQKLPVRKGQGTGSYVIREIVKDETDENLDQHLTVTLSNNIPGYQKGLTYLLFDQTIERNLNVGDYLVSWDGHVKYEIEELNFNTNTIKMRILYGDFSDIFPYTDSTNTQEIDDASKLRYFSEADLFNDEKYIKVPLEEDRYIYIAIAPINDRMNIRAPWGAGVVVDTDALVNGDNDNNVSFRSYYETCRNIGDILNEISKVMSNTTSRLGDTEINDYMNAVPVIDTEIIKVTHINKHLDDAPTIKNIRALYSQKNSYNADLSETQNSITSLQEQLSSTDFEDTTGIRTQLQDQINELTTHKNDLINSLIKITEEIALAANNSVIPIEGAKYRVRGFFDFDEFANKLHNATHSITPDHIKGIYVQYRYRNVQQEVGTAETFAKDSNGNGTIDSSDKTFIFSDWNELPVRLRPRVRNADGTYSPYQDTSNMNLPSFNQIDIPITQGENVDVRLRVIYDYGQPFISMVSAWSDIVTFEFPDEFTKDIQITDILKENNDDIETNRFKSILSDTGVTSHVDDKITDQNITYFHKPESISSGFYTAERRIIPLSDKLRDMDNKIIQLVDEVQGTTAEQLEVKFIFDKSAIILEPYSVGNVSLKEYSAFAGQTAGEYGNYDLNSDGNVTILCGIKLTNKSSRSLKIFSMFPGTANTTIIPSTHSKFTATEYTDIYIRRSDNTNPDWKTQTTNQFMYFRNQDIYSGDSYYESDGTDTWTKNNLLSEDSDYVSIRLTPTAGDRDDEGMAVYPIVQKSGRGLLMSYKEAEKYMVMNPGDEIIVPVMVEYKLGVSPGVENIQKTIAFDIRTSLYSDALSYTVKINASYSSSTASKLIDSMIEDVFTSNELKDLKSYNTVVR